MHLPKSAVPFGLAFASAVFWYPQTGALPSDAQDIEPSRPVAATAREAEEQRQRGGGRELVLEQQFNVGPGGTPQIDIPDGDVEVESGTGSTVEVEVFVYGRDLEWAREVFERMEFDAQARGNTVTITARRRSRIRRSEYRRYGGVGVLTRVLVPRQFNADIATDDGDIFVTDLDGTVMLSSGDGDIDVGHIRGERVDIDTADGDVTAQALEAVSTLIRTSDGDIDVRTVTGGGEVQATTSDGDIRIALSEVGDVRLRTNDGDITIYAPTTLAALVDLEAEDLNVSRGFDIAGRITRRRVRGEINGGGPLLEASTHDGTVTLRPLGRR